MIFKDPFIMALKMVLLEFSSNPSKDINQKEFQDFLKEVVLVNFK